MPAKPWRPPKAKCSLGPRSRSHHMRESVSGLLSWQHASARHLLPVAISDLGSANVKMLLTPLTAMMSLENNWSECVKFEILKHFHILFYISMWQDFHQNPQYWKWQVICYRMGKDTVCRHVHAFSSPEILQSGAVKGLIEKGKTGSLVTVLSILLFVLCGAGDKERVLKVWVNSFCNHWEMWCSSLLWSVRLSGWLHVRRSMVREWLCCAWAFGPMFLALWLYCLDFHGNKRHWQECSFAVQ